MSLSPLLLADVALPTPMRAVLAVWMACVGGCIGSFMNVVVYRLPLGKSLVFPSSACPACGHLIRWYHNIPVLGWLILQGRCYDCDKRIAARYPLVEAVVAAMFFIGALRGPLAADELSSVGGLLVFEPMEWAVLAYQLALLCVMFCLALMEFDARRQERLGGSLALPGNSTDPGFALPERTAALAQAQAWRQLLALAALVALSGALFSLQTVGVVAAVAAVGYIGVIAVRRLWPKVARWPWAQVLFAVALCVWLAAPYWQTHS